MPLYAADCFGSGDFKSLPYPDRPYKGLRWFVFASRSGDITTLSDSVEGLSNDELSDNALIFCGVVVAAEPAFNLIYGCF